ncbi:MAG: hypothetical protein ACYC35_29750 [Pirellulales bacterium]
MRMRVRALCLVPTVVIALAGAGNVRAGLVGQDIGTPDDPHITGHTTESPEGTYTIIGGGSNLGDTADHFHYARQTWTGNFTAVARMTSQWNTNAWAKAGLMAREDLTAGSRNVHTAITPANGVVLQWRMCADQASGGTGNRLAGSPDSRSTGQQQVPVWLLLSRDGDIFTGAWAADWNGAPGIWRGAAEYDSQDASLVPAVPPGLALPAPLPEQLYLGLSVTAHYNDFASRAIFDHLELANLKSGQPAGRLTSVGGKLGGAAFADEAGAGGGPVSWMVERLLEPSEGSNPAAELLAKGYGNVGDETADGLFGDVALQTGQDYSLRLTVSYYGATSEFLTTLSPGRFEPGDADRDGDVDIFDVAAMQTKYGLTSGATWADGDFDGNGTVDIFDVAAMQPNYGHGVANSPVAVPEPYSLIPAVLGGLALLGLIGRRRRSGEVT